MAVVFCAPFDKNFVTCVPFGLTPSMNPNGIISTTTKKFGLGSLTNKIGGQIQVLRWSSINVIPGDEGAIAFWWQGAEVVDPWGIEIRINHIFGRKLWFKVTWSPAPSSKLYYVLSMSAGDGSVFNNIAVVVATSPSSNFHHAALNWLWNDGSGKTEMFYDGSSIWSSFAGNAKTRAGGGTATVQVDMRTTVAQADFLDDFTITDVRPHIANFDVPTGPLCPCSKRRITLGTPLGISNSLGR